MDSMAIKMLILLYFSGMVPLYLTFEVCEQTPTEPEPPDFDELAINKLLADGILHIIRQITEAKTWIPEVTFVFGNIGSAKTTITQLMVGDFEKLGIGFSNKNSSFIFRADIYTQNNNTSGSMTLLPDYYVTQSVDFGQAAFWDCPGFGYNLGLGADVAEMYFLKYVLEFTKSAKFIFTVKHSSLMLQDDIRKLATYATTLIRNATKFKNSIGLVVTELESQTDLDDDSIVLSIKDLLQYFIEEEKEIIQAKIVNNEIANSINLAWERIAFVEGLLEIVVGVNEKSRISFIKNPTICGSLSNMSAVLDTVANLNELQFKLLQHSNITSGDLGFILRAETFKEIEQLLHEADYRDEEQYTIKTALMITKQLDYLFIENGIDIALPELLNGFQDSFDRNYGRLLDSCRELVPDREELLNPVVSNLNVLMTCASQRLRTMQFFNDVLYSPYEAPFPKWSKPLQIVDSGSNDLIVFYRFCNNIYHAFKEYSTKLILKEAKKVYNKDGSITNFPVNIFTVLDFLTKANFSISSEIRIIWGTIGEKDKQFLVNIVKKHLPGFPEPRCVAPSIVHHFCARSVFVGKTIFLSDVLEKFLTVVNEDNFCCKPNNRLERKEVTVVAGEKFYVDVHLHGSDLKSDVPLLLHLTIVAPVWEVIPAPEGYREIVLYGQYAYKELMHGGGFFGVYGEIINSDQLFIQANGASHENFHGGNSGTIHFISTKNNASIYNESVPGKGKWDGYFTEDVYKPVYIVDEYNAAYGKQLLLDCHSSESEEFFWALRFNSEFDQLYTPLTFASELEKVEMNYTRWKAGKDIPKCFVKLDTSLSNYYDKILRLMAKRMIGANLNDTLGFKMIGGFVTNKLISQRRIEKTLNVINIEKYLETLAVDLSAVEKLEVSVAVDRETDKYKDELNDKVKEAEQLIHNKVRPAIKGAEGLLGQMNKNLLNTIKAFIEAAVKQKEKAEEMRKEFGRIAVFKFAMAAMSFVGKAVSLMGPVGSAVGGGLQTAASIGNSVLDGKGSLAPLVPYTKQLVDDSDKYWEGKFNVTDNDSDEVKALKKKKANWAQGLTLVAGATEGVITLVNEIKSIGDQSEQMDQMVQAAAAQVKAMKNKQDEFYRTFAPQLDDITKQVSAETSNLAGTSQSALTVKKFEMKNKLKEMRKLVQSFVKPISEAQQNAKNQGEEVVGEPELYEKFLGSIDTLDEAMVVLFELYNNIETYQERKQLAQFIANVNSPSIGLDALIQGELLRVFKRFERWIRINLLLEEYKKAEHAFKQFVFPFARDYLPTNEDRFGLTPDSTTEEVMGVCRTQIRNFISIIQKYKAITTTNDQYVFYANFSSKLASSKPFFVWENEKWNDTIHKLLQGSSVQLKSNCNQTGHLNEKFFKDKTAIKFKLIAIFIKTHDKNHQQELEETLKNYQISMTHSGMSIYIVNGQHFVMRDAKQTYSYNFENYSSQNVIKYKVTSPDSDFLMSPYTWWTLEIRDLAGNGFKNLTRFAPEVDLELEGTGLYLDETKAGTTILNELHLSDYYNPFEPNSNESNTTDKSSTESSLHHCNEAKLSSDVLPPASGIDVDSHLFNMNQNLFHNEHHLINKATAKNWQAKENNFQNIQKTSHSSIFGEQYISTQDEPEIYNEYEPQMADEDEMRAIQSQPEPLPQEDEVQEEEERNVDDNKWVEGKEEPPQNFNRYLSYPR